MKFLLVADLLPDPDAGASGTQVRMVKWLRHIGHDVDAIWASDLPHRIRRGNLHAVLEQPAAYRAAIRRRLETHAYDVVCVNQPMGYLAAKDYVERRHPGVFIRWSMGLEYGLEEALNHWLPKWGLRKRSRLTSIPGQILDWLVYRQEVLVAKYAAGHIVLCEKDREILVRIFGIPSERTANVHQAPLEEFQRRPSQPLTRVRLDRILSVGQFIPYKGIYHIAETINAALAGHPTAQFTWAGFGTDKRSEALGLLDADVRPRCHLPGKLGDDAFLDLFDQHGIFLFPSINEGFGKTFLEAMARGLCVVATRVGGMPDLITHGVNGFLVDAGDVAGLIRCIRGLWTDPELAARISAAAVQTAADYTWDRVAKNTALFCEKIYSMRSQERR